MLQYGLDAYLVNSGMCKQTSKDTLPTMLSGVNLDSKSTYLLQCDKSDWKIGFPGGIDLSREIPPYVGLDCSRERPYEPPNTCEFNCLNLSSTSNATKSQLIDLVNSKLKDVNSIESILTLNLCSGNYSWPTNAGVVLNRNDTNAKLTLDINCCGSSGTCIFDGKGQTFSQPLFQFDSPILFVMKAITFQNFNYVGSDAAIITTRAFTVMDFQYLKITNVVSRGVSSLLFIK